MGLDLEVVQQKIRGLVVVGLNSAHFGGSQHHHIRTLLLHPLGYCGAIQQIKLLATGQQLVVVPLLG